MKFCPNKSVFELNFKCLKFHLKVDPNWTNWFFTVTVPWKVLLFGSFKHIYEHMKKLTFSEERCWSSISPCELKRKTLKALCKGHELSLASQVWHSSLLALPTTSSFSLTRMHWSASNAAAWASATDEQASFWRIE